MVKRAFSQTSGSEDQLKKQSQALYNELADKIPAAIMTMCGVKAPTSYGEQYMNAFRHFVLLNVEDQLTTYQACTQVCKMVDDISRKRNYATVYTEMLFKDAEKRGSYIPEKTKTIIRGGMLWDMVNEKQLDVFLSDDHVPMPGAASEDALPAVLRGIPFV